MAQMVDTVICDVEELPQPQVSNLIVFLCLPCCRCHCCCCCCCCCLLLLLFLLLFLFLLLLLFLSLLCRSADTGEREEDIENKLSFVPDYHCVLKKESMPNSMKIDRMSFDV